MKFKVEAFSDDGQLVFSLWSDDGEGQTLEFIPSIIEGDTRYLGYSLQVVTRPVESVMRGEGR